MMLYENTRTVYDLVHNAAAEHGDRVFLQYEENGIIFRVTYKEFACECDAIAAWAREKRAQVGHKLKVGILGVSSHHYLAVLLGVMSGGDTGIPLDVQLNAQKLADCLNRSDVDVLFYDWAFHPLTEEVKDNCPAVVEYISLQHGKHVNCSDKLLKAYEGQHVESDAKADECAMILFTSGTTGRGKGVMLSNGNLMDNNFCTTDNNHPEREIYLNVLPIHHVFCLNGDVFTVMRYGGILCLNRDMKKLAEHILLFEPTVIRMVPMMAKALYNRIAILNRQHPEVPVRKVKEQVLGTRLHKIISGGGYLAPDLAANYQRLGIAIAQGYGMSECSPKISSPDWTRPDKIASVGRIVDRCEVRIVDGEIQVRSPSVMMGYYKEPDKTAEAITPDGWLCTGDIGHVDEEGFLYLTGRKKNLIILSNGETVAPEALENLFEDERLIEMSFGIYEGCCYTEENRQVPQQWIENFFHAPQDYVAAPGGEILDDVEKRTRDFMEDICSRKELQDKTILVSTHGCALRGLLNSIRESNREDYWHGGVSKNCAVSIVTCNRGEKPVLVEENHIYY